MQAIAVCLLSFLCLTSSLVFANGVKSTFGYDDLHRLTAIEHKKGTKVLAQFNYALSADGKRNTVQEYISYPASQPVSEVNRTVFYGYDAAGRLNAEQRQNISTLRAGGTVKNTTKTLWSYDKVGNRLTQNTSNYVGLGVDSPSVLKSTFNTNYAYNANGSQTAITTNVGKPDEKTIPYFYDFEQKLTAIGNAANPIHHAYTYDADGNRISETNTNAGTTDTRNYLVDPNNSNAQILEEYNNTNKLLAHYDWNDAELLREATRTATESTFTIRQPLADGHNSTRQLTDTTGAIRDVYAYDAWGNQQQNVGSSFNPYRYNSQRLDASGLYYLRARQYSSGIGRFLTHDPLMGNTNNPITQHRYLYAGDDGSNFTDPSGNFTVAELAATSAIVGSLLVTINISHEVAIVNNTAGYNMSISNLLTEPYHSAIVQAANSSNLKPLFLASIVAYELDDIDRGDRIRDFPAQLVGLDTSIGIAQTTYRTSKKVHPALNKREFLKRALDPISSIKLAAEILRFEANNPPSITKDKGGIMFQYSFVSDNELRQSGDHWGLDAERMMAYVYTQGWQWDDIRDSSGRYSFHINESMAGDYGITITDDYMSRGEFIAAF